MVNVGLSGSTGTVNFVGSTSPTLITPILGAATATSLTFNPTTGGIVGTTTNDNAGAGKVGEYVTATGTTVSVTSGAGKTITSISLTAGDWDVWGEISFAPAAGTTVTLLSGSVSSTDNTNETNTSLFFIQTTFTTSASQFFVSAPTRKSLSTTTTIYYTTFTGFAVSTMTATATIAARRIR